MIFLGLVGLKSFITIITNKQNFPMLMFEFYVLFYIKSFTESLVTEGADSLIIVNFSFFKPEVFLFGQSFQFIECQLTKSACFMKFKMVAVVQKKILRTFSALQEEFQNIELDNCSQRNFHQDRNFLNFLLKGHAFHHQKVQDVVNCVVYIGLRLNCTVDMGMVFYTFKLDKYNISCSSHRHHCCSHQTLL